MQNQPSRSSEAHTITTFICSSLNRFKFQFDLEFSFGSGLGWVWKLSLTRFSLRDLVYGESMMKVEIGDERGQDE
ncbi:unnamed protein product [Lathyrus oleraceus]